VLAADLLLVGVLAGLVVALLPLAITFRVGR